MFWVSLLLLLMTVGAGAQTNPGFIEGAVLCANTGCTTTPPISPLGLNQAFANKFDVGIGGVITPSQIQVGPAPFISSLLTLNGNITGSPGSLPPGATYLHVIGANSDTTARVVIDSFNSIAAVNGRRADGTASAPAALGGVESIYNMNAFGWDGTNYFVGGQYFFAASAAWTGSSHPTTWQLNTVLAGQTTPAGRLLVDQNGNLEVTGNLLVLAMPTAPVAPATGVSYVCIDTNGNLYRKATCP